MPPPTRGGGIIMHSIKSIKRITRNLSDTYGLAHRVRYARSYDWHRSYTVKGRNSGIPWLYDTLVVIKFYPLPCFQCTTAATRLFIYSRTISRDYVRDQISFLARGIKIPCKSNTQTSICLLFLHSFYSVSMNTLLRNGMIGSRKGLRIVRLINS